MTGAARLYTFGQSEAPGGHQWPIRSWENLHIETVWPKKRQNKIIHKKFLIIYASARCKQWYFYVSGLLRTSQTFLHKSMDTGQQAARLRVSQVTLSVISGVSWECLERWSLFPSHSQSVSEYTKENWPTSDTTCNGNVHSYFLAPTGAQKVLISVRPSGPPSLSRAAILHLFSSDSLRTLQDDSESIKHICSPTLVIIYKKTSEGWPQWNMIHDTTKIYFFFSLWTEHIHKIRHYCNIYVILGSRISFLLADFSARPSLCFWVWDRGLSRPPCCPVTVLWHVTSPALVTPSHWPQARVLASDWPAARSLLWEHVITSLYANNPQWWTQTSIQTKEMRKTLFWKYLFFLRS